MERPTVPPTIAPTLPGATAPTEPPFKGARLTWAHTSKGWEPLWALPSVHGIAVQATPFYVGKNKKIEWRLGILHEASGFTVCNGRQGRAQHVLNTPTNRKAIAALLADLQTIGVDWTLERPQQTMTPLEIGEAVACLVARHLPAIPEWRAWRTGLNGLEHKWHATAAAAQDWADRGCAGFALIESWTVPPPIGSNAWNAHGEFHRECSPDFAKLAAGRMPEGMTGASWKAWGVQRSAAPGKPAEPFPISAAPTPGDVRGLAYADAQGWPCLPTGERMPGPAAAIAASLVTLGEHGHYLPTRAGLLLVSRAALAGHWGSPSRLQRTSEAREEWRKARRRARNGASIEGSYWREALGNLGDCLEAWIHLLGCIARDRAAGVRFELHGRWTAASILRVISHEAGVACIEVSTAAEGRTWLTCRVEPVVSWAAGSALVATRWRDPAFAELTINSIEEHRAADWAENHAARMRAGNLLH